MGAVYRVDRCPHCGKTIRQRSGEQNDALHGYLHSIANQIDWPRGSKQFHSTEVWKRLFVLSWERSEGRSAEIYPAIDGRGVDVVGSRTSRMNKQELSELIEFVIAQGTEWGVDWDDKEAA